MILTSICAIAYPIVIQYKRGGWWEKVFGGFAFVLYLLDVIANNTEFAIVWGAPREGERTISQRIKRMAADPQELPARQKMAGLIQIFLDSFEPDGKH